MRYNNKIISYKLILFIVIFSPTAIATPLTSTPSPSVELTLTPVATVSSLPSDLNFYTSPVLIGPLNKSHLRPEEDIFLIWVPVSSLAEDEWYEVQLWKPGEAEQKAATWTKENIWQVERKYYPGLYNWRIVIVLGRDEQRQKELSPPSQTWTFSWGGARVVQTPTPDNLATPESTPATPTPTPQVRPTPELLKPIEGQNFATPFIILKWRWEDELAPDEFFDIQIRPEGQGESVFVDWSRQTYYQLSRWAGWKAGRYTWTIALVRGHMVGKQRVLEQYLGYESEHRVFRWDEGGK